MDDKDDAAGISTRFDGDPVSYITDKGNRTNCSPPPTPPLRRSLVAKASAWRILRWNSRPSPPPSLPNLENPNANPRFLDHHGRDLGLSDRSREALEAMKASLKFREEQRPLWRAKVPISILGLPFLSGFAAGEPRELRLDLATAFESGPSLRVSYRPSDPWNPFSLVLKTGTGALGSPAASPMAMSVEFSLLGRAGPAFRVLFKPRLGDFVLKKNVSSSTTPPPDRLVIRGIGDEDGGGIPAENGIHGKKPNGFLTEGFRIGIGVPGSGGGGINGLMSGTEISASSALPLRGRTAVKFRWGVRVPAELHTVFDSFGRDRTAEFPLGKLPLLVMSKVSVEHVAEDNKAKQKGVSNDVDQVAEACLSVKRQLEVLQADNGHLRRKVEELRAELGGWKLATGGGQVPAVVSEASKDGPRPAAGKRERWSEGRSAEVPRRAMTEDTNDELRKALMGATGTGR